MASDAFTDDNGTSLSDHDANWTAVNATWGISGVTIQGNVARNAWSYTGGFWAGSSEDTSQIVVKAGTTGARGPGVRMNDAGAGTRGYRIGFVAASGGNWTALRLYKDGSTLSDIGSLSYSQAADHTLKIVVSGTTTVHIDTFVDGNSTHSEDDSSSPIGAGHPGFCANGDSATEDFDDWTDGAAEGPTPVAGGSDSGRVGQTETVKGVATLSSPAQTQRVGLTDGSSGLALLSLAETLGVGLTDAVSFVQAVQAAETVPIGVAEVASLTATLDAADLLPVGLADAAAFVSAILQTADTLQIGTAEATTIVTQILTALDACAIGLTDGPALVSAVLQLADLLGIGTMDAIALITALLDGATDATALGVTDTALIQAVLDLADTLPLGLADLAALAVPITAADVLSAGLTDLLAALASAHQVADTVGLTTAEAITLITALTEVGDTLGIGLTDAPVAQAVWTLADTLGIVLTDATLSVTDVTPTGVPTYRIGLEELTATLTIAVQVADDLSLGLADGITLVTVLIQAAETVGVSLTEAASIAATLSLADVLGIGLADAAVAGELGTALTSADVVALGFSDLTDLLSVAASQADAHTLSLSDAIALVSGTVQLADVLALGHLEAAAISAILSLADTLGITLTDLVTVGEAATALSSADTLPLGLTDLVDFLTLAQRVGEELTLGLTDAIDLVAALVNTADTLGLPLADTIETFTAVLTAAEETLALGATEAAGLAIAILGGAADALALGTADGTTITVSLVPSDLTGLTLADAVTQMTATLDSGDAVTAALLEQPAIQAILSAPGEQLAIHIADLGVLGNVYRIGHVIVATVRTFYETRTVEQIQVGTMPGRWRLSTAIRPRTLEQVNVCRAVSLNAVRTVEEVVWAAA